MAVRAAGIRLTMEGLNAYLAGGRQVDEANKKTKGSLDSFAEAERRATAAVRGAMQQRAAAARAESQERIQAARASAAQIIEQERRLTATLRAEIRQREAEARRAARQSRGGVGGAILDTFGGVGGLVAGGIGGLVAVQASRAIVEQAQLGANNARLTASFHELAAGINISGDALRTGLRNAVQGTVADTKLLTSSNLILSSAQDGNVKVTQEQIETLARFARLRSTQLPNLTTENAFERLTVGIVKRETELLDELGLSTKGIADQLGIDVSEVNKDVNALLQGVVKVAEIEIKRFGDPVIDDATRIEQSFAQIENSFNRMRGSLATPVAVVLKVLADVTSGAVDAVAQTVPAVKVLTGRDLNLSEARSRITQMIDPQAIGPRVEQGVRGLVGNEVDPAQLSKIVAVIDQFDQAVTNGAPNLEKYKAGLLEIANAGAAGKDLTAAQIGQLYELDLVIQQAAAGYETLTQAQIESAKAAAEAATAQKLSEARTEIDELAKSSLDLFAQGAPGADELVNSVIKLQAELTNTTELTDKDKEAIDELAQAYQIMSAAAGGSVGSLDAETVAAYRNAQANDAAAASIRALQAAQAGVSRGIVSSISGLVGGGIINQGQALAIERSQQQQAAAGFAGIEAQGLQGPALAFATAGLQRELEAPFREWDQISKNITQEAHAQHQASQGAGKAWDKASKDAEKAAKATAKALESVEGLFGASKVTQGQLDIAAGGGAVNVPDDFLRRFRDVSENFDKNGFRDDFGQEQLNEARAALERIGVQPLDDLKGIFAQFEEAWINSSLFSSKENLALINKQAVEDNLALQKKMEEGRKNIFEMFGIAIDDSIEAMGGGGSVPFDQEGLNKKLAEAESAFWEGVAQRAANFNTSGVSLSDQVRGGKAGGIEGLQQSFNDTTSTSDILRGTFAGVIETSDILRERLVFAYEAADTFKVKIDEIPQLVWYGDGGVIDTFPAWKGDEGIIPVFPGWDAWLGPEKPNTGPTDMGATGTAGATTVTPVQQAMTQPAVNTTNNTRSTNVTINSNQSTGNLLGDWAIIEAKSR